MKTLQQYLLYTLSLLILLGASCSSKEDCPDFDCQNGGTCFNGACACLEGFAGADCSEAILAPLSLMRVKVIRFPAVRLSGEEWDGGFSTNAPDIFIRIDYQGSTLYAHRDDYSEADNNQVYTFDIPPGEMIFYYPNQSYTLVLYDRDSYTDDVMGTLDFVPFDFVGRTANYPVSFVLDNGGRVAFELTLEEN